MARCIWGVGQNVCVGMDLIDFVRISLFSPLHVLYAGISWAEHLGALVKIKAKSQAREMAQELRHCMQLQQLHPLS